MYSSSKTKEENFVSLCYCPEPLSQTHNYVLNCLRINWLYQEQWNVLNAQCAWKNSKTKDLWGYRTAHINYVVIVFHNWLNVLCVARSLRSRSRRVMIRLYSYIRIGILCGTGRAWLHCSILADALSKAYQVIFTLILPVCGVSSTTVNFKAEEEEETNLG